ncbi:telomere repeat-binding factor 4-like [Mangifera indica]|uniref:telomere repeat-binding factor 4-like n=1 Tax=Mangifera indica TaxID=29780 RepID=UPI001CFC252E|nr:telomere repeat-binding factor 4-like [Mangifera indica]
MGNPKQKWTSEEEEALRAGVAKHGTGKWKNIQRDPEFNPFLFSRSNIDLKDKWRNMSVSAGLQGPREKSRTLKPKAGSDAPAAPLSTPQTSTATTAVAATATAAVPDASVDSTIDDSARSCAPKYNALIFEAISTLKEPNGSDVSAILSFIEQRLEVPQNFRRQLSSRLRRLVAQEKLEKVQNCFKLKEAAVSGTQTPIPKQKDIRPRPLQSINHISSANTVEAAAVAAASQIADAENKSFVAAEAVKEAERISRMAEDTDSLLQLAKEIFEKCSQGEVVLMAY